MHPVLFKIGTFEVPSFGAAMVVAFLLSVTLAQTRGPKYGVTKEQVGDFAFWTILAGVFGARLLFILQDLPYYIQNWRQLLTLRFQGLTSFGGLIFGLGAAVLWSKKRGVPLKSVLDAVAPAFLLGHLIGRVGCLLNGCCFGGSCPADLPWGIKIAGNPVLLHPAQIYDSLMNLAALGLVLFIERKARLKSLQLTGLVVALHGVARFVYEFWRAGTQAQVDAGQASSTYWGTFPITQAQGMALALVIFGAALFAFAKRTKPAATSTDDSPTPQAA